MNASGNVNKQTTIKVSPFRLEEIGRIVAKLIASPFSSTIFSCFQAKFTLPLLLTFLVGSKLSIRRITQFFSGICKLRHW
ncbi:hypothetical protein GHT06_018880 [Daphnia sinensis]|uniref:Uncharacterized protein n=1 Tax=Daphnia sinensis TaxID=1820382 RepID=A0AAD5PQP3_9CRUS|nr:hypothetical protein GHT06_018880 [Daphnia sinensis]